MSTHAQEALAAVAHVEGWMTDAQGRRLHACAALVPPGGTVVEIGSFRGRSAIVLALAAPADARIVCIDPHAGSDRGPQEIAADAALGDADTAAFAANLCAAGVADRITHVRAFSDAPEAFAAVDGPVDLLYVDGAHRYGPALADLRLWGDRVAPGGTMLVHDTFSSVGVTLATLRALAPSGRWAYAGRDGSLARWLRTPAPRTRAARGRETARVLAELPWFVRNVLVKALILARLRPVARVLGHGPADGPWPY